MNAHAEAQRRKEEGIEQEITEETEKILEDPSHESP
jgi:hypothetical protein